MTNNILTDFLFLAKFPFNFIISSNLLRHPVAYDKVYNIYRSVLNFNKVFYLLLKLVNCSLLSPCYVIIDNLDSLDNFLYHSKNNVKNCKESDKLHSLCSKMTQYNPELGSVPSQHLRQSFL